jgi:hypothetical protein
MIPLRSHASFDEYRENVWERFSLTEDSFPLEDKIILPDEEYFLGALHTINTRLAFQKLANDSLISFSMFTAFFLKSTLLFDASFFESMKLKKAKLLLMQADLYLVQGGIEFSLLPNHQTCHDLLDKTLSSIALTHNLFDRPTLNQRYSSIFFCAMVAPYLLTKTKDYSTIAFSEFSQCLSHLLCLEHHPYLSDYSPESADQINAAKYQLQEVFNKFPHELSMLGIDEIIPDLKERAE